MPLTDLPHGNYRFLPGIAPYSCGVVADRGFEIVRVALPRFVPFRAAFEKVARFLDEEGRPKSALCAIELRSPRPFSFEGFAQFNAEYESILRGWNLFVDGVNPVARTNVAPVSGAPREPSLYAFSYTRPCEGNQPPTFVVAGAGELPEGILEREQIIARGNTSRDGLAIKSGFVLELMQARLRGLGLDWSDVSTVDVYTAHSLTELLPDMILSRIGPAGMHGITWHYSRPPIEEIEYEMDLRGIRNEQRLA